MAKPFIKWAGGKRQMLGQYMPHIPQFTGRYYEPMVGGGAMFFHLKPGLATLSDTNTELINAYQQVKYHVDSLIALLKLYPNDSAFFYKMRAKDPGMMNDLERAARFIYLNKTCYNGLYRVNRKGDFNAPFGKYKNPKICDEQSLRDVSAALATASLVVSDFTMVARWAGQNDLVYFDPPYYPRNATSNFTGYMPAGFSVTDHEHLAMVFKELDENGAYVMLSNSDTEFVRKLYTDLGYGKSILTMKGTRAINCKAGDRGAITELLICSWLK